MEKISTIKKVALVAIAVMGVLAALLLLPHFIPAHPSPEYEVDSYDELMDELDGLCILPERNTFNNDGSKYTVYLKSRFSDQVIGYIMSFTTTGKASCSITVEGRAANELPEESQQITPTEIYEGVELAVEANHICFILNDFRYDIHGVNSDDSFEQAARFIAQNMIDSYRHD